MCCRQADNLSDDEMKAQVLVQRTADNIIEDRTYKHFIIQNLSRYHRLTKKDVNNIWKKEGNKRRSMSQIALENGHLTEK